MKNLFDIKDKVIVITGGCGILGKNIANYLAEQGAKIVILDRVEAQGKELEADTDYYVFSFGYMGQATTPLFKELFHTEK